MKNYTPDWKDVVDVTKSIAVKNCWRTEFLSIGYDDLYQEGWIVFNKCLRREDNVYECKKHFIGFFKQAFLNKILDIIKYKRNEKENTVVLDNSNEGDDCSDNHLCYSSDDSSDFKLKLSEAPIEIRMTITLLMMKQIKINRITNKNICECLGYDYHKRNIIAELKEYFLN